MAPSASIPDLPDILREVHAQAKSVPKTDELGYSIPDSYLGSRRPVKVLIIGWVITSVTGSESSIFAVPDRRELTAVIQIRSSSHKSCSYAWEF